MFGIVNFGTFIIAGILLNLTPGTDTMYTLGNSMSKGKQAGFMAALGIGAGSLVHTMFATFGLSVILAESALAFNVVKYLGAAYLVYLGVKSLLSRGSMPTEVSDQQPKEKTRKVFFSAILTNVLNPKVALFYLAFLPQFINPSYANPVFSFLVLGITFTLTGTLWCLMLAAYASKLSTKIQQNSHVKVWFDRLTGAVFIGLGLKLAIAEK